MDRNTLLMKEVREEWAAWLELTEGCVRTNTNWTFEGRKRFALYSVSTHCHHRPCSHLTGAGSDVGCRLIRL